ncbi:MAG TPA: hypothetical protein VJZ00_02740 [Thermoanaerobaculia bacterium]|nr:hypothetical protein [Thermoanaerobaculia bacterium]
MTRIRCAFALLAAVVCVGAFAQTSPYDPATAPHVTKAIGSGPFGSAGLGRRVQVTVRNFPKLLDQVSGNCHGIVMFIDGMPLRGMPPDSCNPYDGTVRYLLDRVPDQNDAEWHRILGSPNDFIRKVRISVGSNDQFAVPTDVIDFPLEIIPGLFFYLYIVLLILGVFLFVYLCRNTTLIRAPVDPSEPGMRPYSLSRFQMSFWSFLVMAGYVFAWMITGELDTITDSVLALIGIGAGTALGAALIDATPATTAKATTATASPDGTTATVTSVNVPVAPARPHASNGFLKDVLSDDSSGISIHRFQMFAWTLILGVIFVASVYKDLSMPEFNTTLLGLMGISNGTYLGFKFPEKKRNDQEAGAA